MKRIKHGFSNLKELSVGSYNARSLDEELAFDLAKLKFFLRLPTLRSFYGEGVRLSSYVAWRPSPSTCSIPSITLHLSNFGAQEMDGLIKSCISLTLFEFTNDIGDICLKDVMEPLLQHKNSLKTLYLNFYVTDMRSSEVNIDFIGSLKCFSKLTHLHLDYPRLVGSRSGTLRTNLWELFPESIEYLSLSTAFRASDGIVERVPIFTIWQRTERGLSKSHKCSYPFRLQAPRVGMDEAEERFRKPRPRIPSTPLAYRSLGIHCTQI